MNQVVVAGPIERGNSGTRIEALPSAQEEADGIRCAWDSVLDSASHLDLLAWPNEILVVAPHPDDETLGCGGLLADLSKHGFDVTLLIVSDGSRSHDVGGLETIRKAEALRAARLLGISTVVWAGYPDGGLQECHERIVQEVMSLLPHSGVVLSPLLHDGHSDHDAVASAICEIEEYARAKGCYSDEEHPPQSPMEKRLLFFRYGVWTFTRSPFVGAHLRSFRYELSAAARRQKLKALQEYKSQVTTLFGEQIVTRPLLEAADRNCELLWS
jgi:LmbE family N-acetylglucosaminyl deacetylase